MKGSLFLDYVRMIRGQKSVDWTKHLQSEDMEYLTARITLEDWYPMESFERLGNAILAVVAGGNVDAVRMWGRITVDQLGRLHPELIAESDPLETLARFRVLRRTFFDFEAFEFKMLTPSEALVAIQYHMGATAEEAACYQALGFFERVLELSGAAEVKTKFLEKAWEDDASTLLELRWR